MKVAILGTGDISKIFMSCAEVTQTEVAGVFNRHADKAADFAAAYNVPQAYGDYEQLLQETEADTIYVGLPNGLHYGYAKQALEHGKNVLIEKPFCSNLREFDDLCATAKEHGVMLIEMDRVTAQPNFQILKDHLADAGKIRAVSMDFCQYSRKYDAYLQGNVGNVFTTQFSGGALMDLGVYCVHLMTALFGLPQQLIYIADKIPTGVDISGNLVLRYPEMVVTILVSKNSIGSKLQMIQGEKGTFKISSVPGLMDDIWFITRHSEEKISMQQDYEGEVYTLAEMQRIIDGHDQAAADIRLAHSREVMLVLDSARRSAGIVFEADQN